MSGSAAAIRAGKAYVELSTRDAMLRGGLVAAEQKLKAFGQRIQAMGQKMFAGGAAAVAPFGLSVKTFASYEEALSKLRAAANPTAEQFDKLKGSIDQISKSTSTGPAEVAAAMTELLKAGMSVEQVLGGAAEAALKFAKIGEMDVAQAATVMNDALNVFKAEGLSATQAVDILSKAADASSISVEDVAQSFSMSAAVAALAEQSMADLSNAIAIMGQNGVKGSDAGTSLKTMLMRLMAPADEGAAVMEKYGINVRDASGKMLPFRDIIGELQSKLGGLSAQARDAALSDLLGADAIRAGAILMKEGVAGWDQFAGKVGSAMGVGQKFDTTMDNINGRMSALWASAQRAGNAVGETLAPAFGTLIGHLSGAADWLARFAKEHPGLIQVLGVAAAAVAALGAAMMAAGIASKVFGGTIGTVVSALMGLPGAATTVVAHLLVWKERIAALIVSHAALKVAMAGLGIGILAAGMYMAADAAGIFGQKAESAAEAQERLNATIRAGNELVGDERDKRAAAAGDDPQKIREEVERLHRDLTRERALLSDNLTFGADDETIKRREGEIDSLTKRIAQLQEAYGRTQNAAEGAAGALAEADEPTKEWVKAVEQAEGRIEDLQDEVDILAGTATKASAELARMAKDAMPQDVIDRMRELLAEQERLTKAKEAQEKADEKAKQQWDDARDRAKQVTEETRTPAERRRAQLAELERLRQSAFLDPNGGGVKTLIDEETFQRGKSALEREAIEEQLAEIEKRRGELEKRVQEPGGLAGVTANSAEGMNAIARAFNSARSGGSGVEGKLKELIAKQEELKTRLQQIADNTAGDQTGSLPSAA